MGTVTAAIALVLAVVVLIVVGDVIRTCLFIHSNSRERTRLHEERMAASQGRMERTGGPRPAPAE